VSRPPRLVAPGLAHHLLQQGHNAQPVFIDDDDRRAYLAALHEAARVHEVQLHAYALLDNQVQLLLRPPTAAALSRMMQALGRRYVAAFNRRHGRSGTLWAGRFRAAAVEDGAALRQSLLLIDGLASGREGIPWSSAPHRLGLQRDPLVVDPSEYWQLGNTPFEREGAYAALLGRGLDDAQTLRIEHAAAHGWALGSPQFLAQMALLLGRAVQPRPRGRPRRNLG